MPAEITVIPSGVTRWDGEVVLTAHDWMLLERFTGKWYSYRAVQCKTGDSKYLGHKKNPASDPERVGNARKVLRCSISAVCRSRCFSWNGEG